MFEAAGVRNKPESIYLWDFFKKEIYLWDSVQEKKQYI
jgi:hypothetical protein